MRTESFPLGDVLTVTTDAYVLGSIERLYDFLSFMTGESIDQPAKIPSAMERSRESLCEQFPHLTREKMVVPLHNLRSSLSTPRGRSYPLEVLGNWFKKLYNGEFVTRYEEKLSVHSL